MTWYSRAPISPRRPPTGRSPADLGRVATPAAPRRLTNHQTAAINPEGDHQPVGRELERPDLSELAPGLGSKASTVNDRPARRRGRGRTNRGGDQADTVNLGGYRKKFRAGRWSISPYVRARCSAGRGRRRGPVATNSSTVLAVRRSGVWDRRRPSSSSNETNGATGVFAGQPRRPGARRCRCRFPAPPRCRRQTSSPSYGDFSGLRFGHRVDEDEAADAGPVQPSTGPVFRPSTARRRRCLRRDASRFIGVGNLRRPVVLARRHPCRRRGFRARQPSTSTCRPASVIAAATPAIDDGLLVSCAEGASHRYRDRP